MMDVRCLFGKHKWKVIEKGCLLTSPIGILYTSPIPVRICQRCPKKELYLGAFQHPWGPKWVDINDKWTREIFEEGE